MLVIGRITKDAVVKQLTDERQVVEFSIAVNDWYKPKGNSQAVKVSTFFNCSYWINPNIAERLKRGTLVELFGRAGVNVYNDMQGEAKGSLTFHVNNIKVHQSAKVEADSTSVTSPGSITEPVEDLPF
jgi:single-strand DNA-binding protein